jgi:predicted HTH transcriptional regulator
MSLEAKSLSELTSQDLQELVDGKAWEDLTHEFKRDLPGNSDGERMEFLCDVSSFANSSGGYIIHRLEESERGSSASASRSG